jgi:hypothetical protein
LKKFERYLYVQEANFYETIPSTQEGQKQVRLEQYLQQMPFLLFEDKKTFLLF